MVKEVDHGCNITAYLVEVDHEGREGHRDGLSGLDTSEDLVHHANLGSFCRHKATNVCQKHNQANLQQPIESYIYTYY